MGNIVRDIAEAELAEMVKKYLLDEILPKFTTGADYRISEATFAASCFRCKVCGRELAMVLRFKEGEKHLPLNPCTRIVIGIHPDVEEKVEEHYGSKIPFTSGESRYFCGACTGLKTPERICNNGAKELASELHKDPIVDMREYKPDKGCWITVTEFPLSGRLGRFMNYQTDFKSFAWILLGTDLIRHEVLRPFLPLR